METLRIFLLNLQKNIVTRRGLITRIFQVIEVLSVLGFIYVYYQAIQGFNQIALFMYETGLKMGVTAVILYTLTLIPGIITRLQWWPQYTQPISGMLLPFRRHLGILMFLIVYIHMNFTTSIPLLIASDFDVSKIQLLFFQQMGYFAWLLLFPLWLTSNDLSQKWLGKWWKRLHRLTYIALFLIFMHLALIQTNWMYLIGVVGILEIASWIVFWKRSWTQAVPADTTSSSVS